MRLLRQECKEKSDRDGEKLVGKRRRREIQRENDQVDRNRVGRMQVQGDDLQKTGCKCKEMTCES